jgi:tetratricopeptide (TPR) repeat protein
MIFSSDPSDLGTCLPLSQPPGTAGALQQSNPAEDHMRIRVDSLGHMSLRAWSVLVATAVLFSAGCHKFEARVHLKQGNVLYANESYKEALAQFQEGLKIDPAATFAWRSVGLSAMALHRPGVEGEENQQYADIAIDAFDKYLKAHPREKSAKKVEEYLTTVLINSNKYDEALARLEKDAAADPSNGEIERAIITTLLKANRIEEAFQRATRPGAKHDPQLLYTIGVACWGKSYGDPTLPTDTRIQVVDMGLEATKQSLDLDPDFFDAMAYYNLLFREKAKLATTFEEADRFNKEADVWLKKALELREKQKEAGVGGAPAEQS